MTRTRVVHIERVISVTKNGQKHMKRKSLTIWSGRKISFAILHDQFTCFAVQNYHLTQSVSKDVRHIRFIKQITHNS